MRSFFNTTGTVLHTNLGRALNAAAAIDVLADLNSAVGYRQPALSVERCQA